VPDLTFLIDVPVQEGLRRKQAGTGADDWNRMEAEVQAYHERVRQGYLELAAQEPDRWVVLNGLESIEALQAQIRARIIRKLEDISATARHLTRVSLI